MSPSDCISEHLASFSNDPGLLARQKTGDCNKKPSQSELDSHRLACLVVKVRYGFGVVQWLWQWLRDLDLDFKHWIQVFMYTYSYLYIHMHISWRPQSVH